MGLEVKAKCKHCGEIFTVREGYWQEHLGAESKEEWEKDAFIKGGSGLDAFCPKCRKYETVVRYERRKRCSDFMELDEMLNGFTKVGKIRDWEKWIDRVPQEKGVYVITRTTTDAPTFCEVGTGGFFKGKDPNVSIEELAKKWYYSNDRIVYVGRANYDNDNPKSANCESTIQSRLKDYMRFGHGKKVGHKGGRYIWQLADAEELEVWYMATDNPQTLESELIKKHEPFANLKRGDIA